MPVVDVRGVPSHHEVHGSGEPVLLLHGGFYSLEHLRGLGDLLSRSFAVHAVERPGHGRTPDRDGPFDYAEMVLDTLAYLDAFDVGPVHVVGFSDGGIIGLLLALEHPERVRSLVAISANLDPGGFADRHDAEPAPPQDEPPDVDDAELAHAALSPDGPEHAAVVLDKLVTLWRTQPRIDPERLRSIRAPVLVMAGDRDSIAHEHTLTIARHVAGSQLAIIPGAGHGLVSRRPALVNHVVDEFLASLRQPPVATGRP